MGKVSNTRGTKILGPSSWTDKRYSTLFPIWGNRNGGNFPNCHLFPSKFTYLHDIYWNKVCIAYPKWLVPHQKMFDLRIFLENLTLTRCFRSSRSDASSTRFTTRHVAGFSGCLGPQCKGLDRRTWFRAAVAARLGNWTHAVAGVSIAVEADTCGTEGII